MPRQDTLLLLGDVERDYNNKLKSYERTSFREVPRVGTSFYISGVTG